MSHVATIDLHITDLEALKKAAESIGCELVEGVKQYKWFGRHVGDYPLPKGFAASDLGHCEHVIRLKNPLNPQAYEVGVVKRRDGKPGYTLLWDFWGGGFGLQDAIGNDGLAIRQHYAAQVSAAQMRKQGFRVDIKATTDGGLKVRCTK